MKIDFSPPHITDEEINEVVDTLKSGWITTGPKTKRFERLISEFCGTEKTVCLNSATAAMELTLRLLNVGEGDEVITSAYTYSASASVINHVGAKIILVDTSPESYEMDYNLLEDAITERTKAIIPVDIAGVICDYDKILEIVERKKYLFKANNELQKAIGRIVILADGAHSFGATRNGKMSGNIADFTCFSFHAVKNITTAEGGAVTWKNIKNINNEDIYKEFMLLSLHGQSKDALSKMKPGSWEYDIVYLGYKCNMTDIMSSLGLVQLRRLPELYQRRKDIIELYINQLDPSKVKILKHFGDSFNSSMHLFLIRINDIDELQRNKIIIELAEMGISTNVHYKPLPMLSAYKNLGFNINDFPNAFNQYTNGITLPLHTLLKDDEVKYICDNLMRVIDEMNL